MKIGDIFGDILFLEIFLEIFGDIFGDISKQIEVKFYNIYDVFEFYEIFVMNLSVCYCRIPLMRLYFYNEMHLEINCH